ncbi:MAG: DUF3048 domain-containing protein [Clostridia bacterium]|nr:DUF3048 domain-containing protein [Clostridia bacterium]
MKKTLKLVSLLLAFVMMLGALASCGGDEAEESATETETEKVTEKVTETETETEIELVDLVPENINQLTGLEAAYDVSTSRPIGVMFNNIHDALPQVGIGGVDILFECLAEGGITRLFGLFDEYNDLGVLGSIRSCRPYYLDFAQMFDAIYVHAGGSEDAYSDIANRGINNIDGVRFDPLGVYYRDEERMQTMLIEHTLMTTGQGIIDTIEYCNYRTELRDGYEYPFVFPEWAETTDIGGEESKAIHLPISWYQTVDYKYDEADALYLRYQYDGEPHIDGATGEQLKFTNVIVLFCDTYVYDGYGRLKVNTVGDGDGFLATGGKYIPIKWHRDGQDTNAVFTRADNGEIITINRGKTAINVCPTDIVNDVSMNAN